MMIYRSIKIAFLAASLMVGLTGFSGLSAVLLSGTSGTAHAASLLASPYANVTDRGYSGYARMKSDHNRAVALGGGGASVLHVAEDCASVGQKVAAAQGGTLTKATSAVQNGAPVCVVVVLVPGRAGERPRRVEVAVPAK